MMKFVLSAFLCCHSLCLLAQSSQVSTGAGVLMLIDVEDRGAAATENFERGSYTRKEHILGDSITSLLDKIEFTYIYFKEVGGAYSTKEKQIEKPIIYSSLNKVMKYYDKMLRKEKVEEERAREELYEILNNGILLKNYNTEVFERKLKSTRNPAELARLFRMVRFE